MEAADADPLDHAHVDRQRQAGLQQHVHLRGRRLLPRLSGRAHAGRLSPEPVPRHRHCRHYQTGSRAGGDCLWNIQALTNRTTSFNTRSRTSTYQTVRKSWEVKTRRHLPPVERPRRRPQPEVRRRLAQEPDHDVLALQRRRACPPAVRRQQQCQLRQRRHRRRRIRRRARAVSGGPLPRPAAEQQLVDLQRLHPGFVLDRPLALQRWRPLRLAVLHLPRRVRAGERDSTRPVAGAVRTGDRHRHHHRAEAAVVQQLVAAPVGDLRPDRQRQDVGQGRLFVLLRHADHAGQQPWRVVHPDDAHLGSEPDERRVQHDGRRRVLERRQSRLA